MASTPPPKYDTVVNTTNPGVGNLKVNDIGWTVPITSSSPLTPLLELKEPKNGLKITKKETKKEYGPFNFFINDLTTGECQFNGEVNFDQIALITGTGADPFTIEIKQIKTPAKSWTFDVIKGMVSLATIVFDTSKKEVVINSSAGGRNYVATEVDMSEKCDLMIKKNGQSITKVEFPEGKGYEPFESTLEFYPTEVPITTTEKELFIALAIVCMLVRNGPIFTRAEHNFWAGLGCAFACGIIIAIVVGLYYLFAYLTTKCNIPGYRCGNTKNLRG